MNDICYPEQHGNWYDLKAAKDVILYPNNYIEIPLGVAMQLPQGYEAIVVPRSSTFKKYGIIMVNSIGVIDSDYCGDNDWWCFPALNITNNIVEIKAGTRIAQFRIFNRQPKLYMCATEQLDNPDRGGLGSTG